MYHHEEKTIETPVIQKRIRINISVSVKGIKTWDCTVEMADTEQKIILAESDKLVKELEKRYPIKEG